MAKKGFNRGGRVVPRMKTFDQKHKGSKGSKQAKSVGESPNYWPLQYPFTEKGKNAGGLL